ncbi:hypothetical protein BDD12DRAFT_872458 [Trichophaea hybrida]|nr:hypothetical protein BDD12DRAFT_872458 [Trichophaea hybrida]
MSAPESPNSTSSPGSDGHYSEVPTEPLPASERQLVHEYMSRRQHFLSDFEKYNPVQNMQMLAHHVFELSEDVVRLRNDFTGSRRLLEILSQNQRDVNESVRDVGHDLGKFGGDVGKLDEKVSLFQGRVTDDIGGLRQDINSLRTEMHSIRQETQQGILELKQMLTMVIRG